MLFGNVEAWVSEIDQSLSTGKHFAFEGVKHFLGYVIWRYINGYTPPDFVLTVIYIFTSAPVGGIQHLVGIGDSLLGAFGLAFCQKLIW